MSASVLRDLFGDSRGGDERRLARDRVQAVQLALEVDQRGRGAAVPASDRDLEEKHNATAHTLIVAKNPKRQVIIAKHPSMTIYSGQTHLDDKI